ncbi:MAG: SDR family NAD(P)-dependent oxidoreductase, partial [Clostridia bacterium]|nr:SDR family NAD(P)-dependent oxidoreductase [Clostridia bacterium]
ILVNNAGYGVLGDLHEGDYESQSGMVDLNCRALTAITTICLKYMEEGSFIVNVCSIASFCPNARMTVYSSTKAYVNSFSRGVRFENRKRGINCLAVCPGPMETEFLSVAGINGNSKTFETLPYCNPVKVAKKSLVQAEKGRAIYTPTAFYKFYRFLAKIAPHGILMHFSKT